jgi:hypothetical protein
LRSDPIQDAIGILLVDPENAMFVAVERNRIAVSLEIAARRTEVVERRFRRHEARLHEAAGGVIDEGEQRAGRAAVFEPCMLRAIDLHQLTEALAATARLVRGSQPVAAIDP